MPSRFLCAGVRASTTPSTGELEVVVRSQTPSIRRLILKRRRLVRSIASGVVAAISFAVLYSLASSATAATTVFQGVGLGFTVAIIDFLRPLLTRVGDCLRRNL